MDGIIGFFENVQHALYNLGQPFKTIRNIRTFPFCLVILRFGLSAKVLGLGYTTWKARNQVLVYCHLLLSLLLLHFRDLLGAT